MKVKVGDKWYDANIEPILIVVSKLERQQISDMADDSKGYYCQCHDDVPVEEVYKFMEIENE